MSQTTSVKPNKAGGNKRVRCVTFSCRRKSCHVPRPKVMAPGAKRKSLDHALASFPAPANRNDPICGCSARHFAKPWGQRRGSQAEVDGYLPAAARRRREEGEVLVRKRGMRRRGKGGDVARRRGRPAGGDAWRATPPSLGGDQGFGLDSDRRARRQTEKKGNLQFLVCTICLICVGSKINEIKFTFCLNVT
jgi:hypothetical protein